MLENEFPKQLEFALSSSRNGKVLLPAPPNDSNFIIFQFPSSEKFPGAYLWCFSTFLGKNCCYHTYTRLNSQHCRNEASFKLSSSLPLPATFTFTFHSKMMMMMIRQNFSLFLCTLCAPWLLSVESLRTTLCTFPSFSAVFFFFILHHDDVARLWCMYSVQRRFVETRGVWWWWWQGRKIVVIRWHKECNAWRMRWEMREESSFHFANIYILLNYS